MRLVAAACCLVLPCTGCTLTTDTTAEGAGGAGGAGGASAGTGDSAQDAGKPGTAVVVCLDASVSYPGRNRTAAQQEIAGALPDLVRGDHRASTVYTYRIAANSYQEPPVLVLTLPGLRKKPGAVGKGSAMQEKSLAGQRKALHERWLQDERLAQGKARDAGKKLAELRLDQAQGTDIGGCLQNASDQFAAGDNRSRERHLVIASDLEAYGDQQAARVRLNGVSVDVIQFACSQAAVCDARERDFRRKLTELGAERVRVSRPGVAVTLFQSGDR